MTLLQQAHSASTESILQASASRSALSRSDLAAHRALRAGVTISDMGGMVHVPGVRSPSKASGADMVAMLVASARLDQLADDRRLSADLLAHAAADLDRSIMRGMDAAAVEEEYALTREAAAQDSAWLKRHLAEGLMEATLALDSGVAQRLAPDFILSSPGGGVIVVGDTVLPRPTSPASSEAEGSASSDQEEGAGAGERSRTEDTTGPTADDASRRTLPSDRRRPGRTLRVASGQPVPVEPPPGPTVPAQRRATTRGRFGVLGLASPMRNGTPANLPRVALPSLSDVPIPPPVWQAPTRPAQPGLQVQRVSGPPPTEPSGASNLAPESPASPAASGIPHSEADGREAGLGQTPARQLPAAPPAPPDPADDTFITALPSTASVEHLALGPMGQVEGPWGTVSAASAQATALQAQHQALRRRARQTLDTLATDASVARQLLNSGLRSGEDGADAGNAFGVTEESKERARFIKARQRTRGHFSQRMLAQMALSTARSQERSLRRVQQQVLLAGKAAEARAAPLEHVPQPSVAGMRPTANPETQADSGAQLSIAAEARPRLRTVHSFCLPEDARLAPGASWRSKAPSTSLAGMREFLARRKADLRTHGDFYAVQRAADLLAAAESVGTLPSVPEEEADSEAEEDEAGVSQEPAMQHATVTEPKEAGGSLPQLSLPGTAAQSSMEPEAPDTPPPPRPGMLRLRQSQRHQSGPPRSPLVARPLSAPDAATGVLCVQGMAALPADVRLPGAPLAAPSSSVAAQPVSIAMAAAAIADMQAAAGALSPLAMYRGLFLDPAGHPALLAHRARQSMLQGRAQRALDASTRSLLRESGSVADVACLAQSAVPLGTGIDEHAATFSAPEDLGGRLLGHVLDVPSPSRDRSRGVFAPTVVDPPSPTRITPIHQVHRRAQALGPDGGQAVTLLRPAARGARERGTGQGSLASQDSASNSPRHLPDTLAAARFVHTTSQHRSRVRSRALAGSVHVAATFKASPGGGSTQEVVQDVAMRPRSTATFRHDSLPAAGGPLHLAPVKDADLLAMAHDAIQAAAASGADKTARPSSPLPPYIDRVPTKLRSYDAHAVQSVRGDTYTLSAAGQAVPGAGSTRVGALGLPEEEAGDLAETHRRRSAREAAGELASATTGGYSRLLARSVALNSDSHLVSEVQSRSARVQGGVADSATRGTGAPKSRPRHLEDEVDSDTRARLLQHTLQHRSQQEVTARAILANARKLEQTRRNAGQAFSTTLPGGTAASEPASLEQRRAGVALLSSVAKEPRTVAAAAEVLAAHMLSSTARSAPGGSNAAGGVGLRRAAAEAVHGLATTLPPGFTNPAAAVAHRRRQADAAAAAVARSEAAAHSDATDPFRTTERLVKAAAGVPRLDVERLTSGRRGGGSSSKNGGRDEGDTSAPTFNLPLHLRFPSPAIVKWLKKSGAMETTEGRYAAVRLRRPDADSEAVPSAPHPVTRLIGDGVLRELGLMGGPADGVGGDAGSASGGVSARLSAFQGTQPPADSHRRPGSRKRARTPVLRSPSPASPDEGGHKDSPEASPPGQGKTPLADASQLRSATKAAAEAALLRARAASPVARGGAGSGDPGTSRQRTGRRGTARGTSGRVLSSKRGAPLCKFKIATSTDDAVLGGGDPAGYADDAVATDPATLIRWLKQYE